MTDKGSIEKLVFANRSSKKICDDGQRVNQKVPLGSIPGSLMRAIIWAAMPEFSRAAFSSQFDPASPGQRGPAKSEFQAKKDIT